MSYFPTHTGLRVVSFQGGHEKIAKEMNKWIMRENVQPEDVLHTTASTSGTAANTHTVFVWHRIAMDSGG